MMERDNVNLAKERILINVGGVRHETYRSTLKMIPDTRLAWIAENKSSNFEGFDASKNEYFFDRHPSVFTQILNYYRTGKLHSAADACGPLFEEELNFWGIDEKQMEPCCWAKYTEHRDAQANLKVFEDPAANDEDMIPTGLPAYLTNEEITPRQKSKIATCFDSFISKIKPAYFEGDTWKVKKRKIFTLMEDHRSSLAAKIVTSFSLFFIIVSVVSICLNSIHHYYHYYYPQSEASVSKQLRLSVKIMDIICFVWFTLEVFVRFFVYCPRRSHFFLSLSNWIDMLSVMSYVAQLIQIAVRGSVSEEIEIFAAFRLLRLFRFFRLSSGLQVLKQTMIASSKEMLLLLLLLMIPVAVFATAVYFCERNVNNTKFKTIPESFWWAIVTMTTVGYGDMAPKTTIGKVFGAICASCSLLILALPVSIIGNNFSLFYSYAQASLKLPKKSQNILVGAANVLVADTNSSHSPDMDGSDDEAMSGSENNNLGGGDVNLSIGKRYRRDRHSLYAGGVVRNARRTMRSRSAGVNGVSSDSEKEQRDSLTRTSNITGTTEADSQSDHNNDNEEKEHQGTHSSESNTDNSNENQSKSNGILLEKPPSGKRRTRTGGQRIHPVITLQVTEDGDNQKGNDRGVDNEIFDGRLDVTDDQPALATGNRTPPVQDLGIFSSTPSLRSQTDLEKNLEMMPKKQFKPPTVKSLNLNLKGSKEKSASNGTALRMITPENKTEANSIEETAVDQTDINYSSAIAFR